MKEKPALKNTDWLLSKQNNAKNNKMQYCDSLIIS